MSSVYYICGTMFTRYSRVIKFKKEQKDIFSRSIHNFLNLKYTVHPYSDPDLRCQYIFYGSKQKMLNKHRLFALLKSCKFITRTSFKISILEENVYLNDNPYLFLNHNFYYHEKGNRISIANVEQFNNFNLEIDLNRIQFWVA